MVEQDNAKLFSEWFTRVPFAVPCFNIGIVSFVNPKGSKQFHSGINLHFPKY